MTLILGFSGRARHGKTEACNAIADHVNNDLDFAVYGHEPTARLYDIGDLIRRYCIANELLPQVERADMSREQLEILINVGKEKRAVDLNFWFAQLIGQIKLDAPDVALLPNLRYANEAAGTRAAGGYIIRMTRLNPDGSTFISDDRPANDISETSLEFWAADFYITQKDGHAALTGEYAVTLYEYLRGLHD